MELVSVKRPDFGTLGKPIQVLANHFKLHVPEKGAFYHYDVTLEVIREPKKAEPEKGQGDAKKGKAKPPPRKGGDDAGSGEPKRLSKDLTRKIWTFFLGYCQKTAGTPFHKILPVFDGGKNVYTMKNLDLKGNPAVFEIVIPRDADGSEMKARVTLKECDPLQIQWDLLTQAFMGKLTHMRLEIFQCLNTVFREAALAIGNKVAAGRSFFWRDNDAFNLNGGAECWRGFYSSVRPCQWKVSLNLDVANTAFYKEMNVLDFFDELCGDTQRMNGPQFNEAVRKLEKELKMLKVEVRGPAQGQIRRYRVTKLGPPAKDAKFRDADKGKDVSVVEYFQYTYNKKVQGDYPVLVVGTKGNMLPMDQCFICKGQKMNKKLNEEQTSMMVRNCAEPAQIRQRRVADLRKALGIVDYDNNKYLKEFGITVEKDMAKVSARVLPAPLIGQGEKKELQVKTDDGTFNAQRTKFVEPKDLTQWVYINLDDDRPNSRVNQVLPQFWNFFTKLGADKGMKIATPVQYRVDSRNLHWPTIFKEIHGKHKGVQMVMVIMRGKNIEYASVKQMGDTSDLHVPTQCVLAKNILKDRGMDQLVGNLLLKMNVKLGGNNNIVSDIVRGQPSPGRPVDETAKKIISALAYFREKPTIVMGCDVTHPSPGEAKSKPSIAALVGSLNRHFSVYKAEVCVQGHRQEIVSEMAEMVKNVLLAFRNQNATAEFDGKPHRIIFYRDGVSEGQYLEVMQREVAAVQKACMMLQADYKPQITYIIVGKRHHTRLLPRDPREGSGKAGNVLPGTITDRDICHFSEFDFFLVSHFGIQGTSRPAHYNVLYDDNKFKADQIQLFSYYLCYVYARCNRSVSIPAPVYYAHHVAFRARAHVGEGSDTASEVSGGSGQISQQDLARMQARVQVKVKGMYFA